MKRIGSMIRPGSTDKVFYGQLSTAEKGVLPACDFETFLTIARSPDGESGLPHQTRINILNARRDLAAVNNGGDARSAVLSIRHALRDIANVVRPDNPVSNGQEWY